MPESDKRDGDFTDDDFTKDFIQVYSAELDYVKERRKTMEPDKPDNPDVKTELVGLSLSGGGIRSATFNLGLLQALAKSGVLQFCDYLSTVSGGGYIGCCMTSLLAETPGASTKADQFPLRDQREGGEERKEVSHLRASKNYLGMSKSLFNMENWIALGLSLSGKILINLLPFSFCCFLIIILYTARTLFYSDISKIEWIRINVDFWSQWIKTFLPFLNISENRISINIISYTIAMISILIVICIRGSLVNISSLINIFSDKTYRKSLKKIGKFMFVGVMIFSFTLLVDFAYSYAFNWTEWENTNFFNYIFLTLLAVSVLLLVGGQLSIYRTQSRQKYIQTIMSVALIFTLIAVPVQLLKLLYKFEDLLLSNYRTKLIEDYKSHNKINLADDIIKNLLNTINIFNNKDITDKFDKYTSKIEKEYDLIKKQYDHEYLKHCDTLKWREKKNGELGKDKAAELLLSVDKEIRDISQNLEEKNKQLEQKNELKGIVNNIKKEMLQRDNKDIKIFVLLMFIISASTCVIGVFLNINDISLHRFYRDRLCKTFLTRNDLLLKEIHKHNNGPYHLINTTLNIPSSDKAILKGRGADFFVFSKLFCGSESTGYRKTCSYNDGETELATAMAISGAAASPEMGTGSNPFLSMVMTVLNYRLNVWMPNPKFNTLPKTIFWPEYLFYEMMGRGSEKDELLNLSDGGHHENLGIYQLLKRRCKIIIASDAGADPGFQMDDFANLQCKARIDLGIDIVMNFDGLRLDGNGLTKKYFVVGNNISRSG